MKAGAYVSKICGSFEEKVNGLKGVEVRAMEGKCRYGDDQQDFLKQVKTGSPDRCKEECSETNECTYYSYPENPKDCQQAASEGKCCLLYKGGPYTYGTGAVTGQKPYMCYSLHDFVMSNDINEAKGGKKVMVSKQKDQYHVIAGICAFAGLGEITENTCMSAAHQLTLAVKGNLTKIDKSLANYPVPYGCTYNKNTFAVSYVEPPKNRWGKVAPTCDGATFDCICEKASQSRVKAELEAIKGQAPATGGGADLGAGATKGLTDLFIDKTASQHKKDCGWGRKDYGYQKSMGDKTEDDCLMSCMEAPNCNFASMAPPTGKDGPKGALRCHHFLTCYGEGEGVDKVYELKPPYMAAPQVTLDIYQNVGCKGAQTHYDGYVPSTLNSGMTGDLSSCIQFWVTPPDGGDTYSNHLMFKCDPKGSGALIMLKYEDGSCSVPSLEVFGTVQKAVQAEKCEPWTGGFCRGLASCDSTRKSFCTDGQCMCKEGDCANKDGICEKAPNPPAPAPPAPKAFVEELMGANAQEGKKFREKECVSKPRNNYVNTGINEAGELEFSSGTGISSRMPGESVKITFPAGKLMIPECKAGKIDESTEKALAAQRALAGGSGKCGPAVTVMGSHPIVTKALGDEPKAVFDQAIQRGKTGVWNTPPKWSSYQRQMWNDMDYKPSTHQVGRAVYFHWVDNCCTDKPYNKYWIVLYYWSNDQTWRIGPANKNSRSWENGQFWIISAKGGRAKCPGEESATGWEGWNEQTKTAEFLKNQYGAPLMSVSEPVLPEGEQEPQRYRYSKVLEDEDEHEMDIDSNNAKMDLDGVPDVDEFAKKRCEAKKGTFDIAKGECSGGDSDTSTALLQMGARSLSFDATGCDYATICKLATDDMSCNLLCKIDAAKKQLAFVKADIEPKMKKGMKEAEIEYKKGNKLSSMCYTIKGLIENKRIDKDGFGDNAEYMRTQAELKLTVAKYLFIDDVNMQWSVIQEEYRHFKQFKDNLVGKVRWMPIMQGPIMTQLKAHFPDVTCLFEGGDACGDDEDAEEDLEAIADGTIQDNFKGMDPIDGIKKVMAMLRQLKGKSKEEVRAIVEAAFDSYVMGPLEEKVDAVLAAVFGFVDPWVELLIQLIAAAVGSFPFVGGILAAVTSLIMSNIYGTIKSDLGDLIKGFIEDLAHNLLNNLLKATGLFDEKEVPAFDFKNGVLAAKVGVTEDMKKLGDAEKDEEEGMVQDMDGMGDTQVDLSQLSLRASRTVTRKKTRRTRRTVTVTDPPMATIVGSDSKASVAGDTTAKAGGGTLTEVKETDADMMKMLKGKAKSAAPDMKSQLMPTPDPKSGIKNQNKDEVKGTVTKKAQSMAVSTETREKAAKGVDVELADEQKSQFGEVMHGSKDKGV
jgi:nitrite reductase/ring-hydroxylating ferredoxin subunit